MNPVSERVCQTASKPSIAYSYRENPGAPVVVLLHSLAMDRTMWAEVVDALADHASLVLIDARGHGASERTGVIGPGEWASDIVRVLDELDIRRATFVGVSMGGMQAIAFAATHPARTTGIVIADSYMALPADIARTRINTQHELTRRLPMTDVAAEYVRATILDATSDAAQLVQDVIEKMTPDDYRAAVTSCFGADVSAYLPRVQAPALVLWGELDAKTPRPLSQAIADALPGSSLITVPDAGHLSCLENPAAFAEAVSTFLVAAGADSSAAAIDPNSKENRK